MGKMKDYKCRYSEYTGIQKEFVESIGLKLPDMYYDYESMAAYVKAVKERDGSSFCRLPIGTVAEGEALGAKIKYDDSPLGPRKDEDILSEPADILSLPRLNPKEGGLAEIIKACEKLRAEGEFVTVEIRGLFDILNSMIDIQKIIMLIVTEPDTMQKISDKIREDIVIWATEVRNHCDLILYSDSSGGINVMGPKVGKKIVNMFTWPLVMDFEKMLESGNAIWLCPKSVFMLLGCDKVKFSRYETECETYIDACRNLPENVKFLGQRCNKDMDKSSCGHIDYIELIK